MATLVVGMVGGLPKAGNQDGLDVRKQIREQARVHAPGGGDRHHRPEIQGICAAKPHAKLTTAVADYVPDPFTLGRLGAVDFAGTVRADAGAVGAVGRPSVAPAELPFGEGAETFFS